MNVRTNLVLIIHTDVVYVTWIPYDWFTKLYSFYMTAVVSIISRHGHNIDAHHIDQPNKIILTKTWNKLENGFANGPKKSSLYHCSIVLVVHKYGSTYSGCIHTVFIGCSHTFKG